MILYVDFVFLTTQQITPANHPGQVMTFHTFPPYTSKGNERLPHDIRSAQDGVNIREIILLGIEHAQPFQSQQVAKIAYEKIIDNL